MWMAPDWSPTTISCWFGWRQAQVTGAFAWKIRCGNKAEECTQTLSKPGRRGFASWDPIFLLCSLPHRWTSTYPLPDDINHTLIQVARFSLPPENQLSWRFWRCLQSWLREWGFRRSGRTSWQHLAYYIPYIVELKSKTLVGNLKRSHLKKILNLLHWVTILFTQQPYVLITACSQHASIRRNF